MQRIRRGNQTLASEGTSSIDPAIFCTVLAREIERLFPPAVGGMFEWEERRLRIVESRLCGRYPRVFVEVLFHLERIPNVTVGYRWGPAATSWANDGATRYPDDEGSYLMTLIATHFREAVDCWITREWLASQRPDANGITWFSLTDEADSRGQPR